MDALPVLAVALAAQFALEFVTTVVREALAGGAPGQRSSAPTAGYSRSTRY